MKTQRGNKTQEGRERSLYTNLTKGDKLWRCDKTKEKNLGSLGVVSCGKVNTRGKLMEEQGLFG